MKLHGAIHDPLGHLGGGELRHGALARDALGPAVLDPRRAPDEEARPFQVHVHLGERHLHGLELGQPMAELAPGLDPAQRLVECAGGHPARRRPHAGPERVEGGEGEGVTLALGAEQDRRRVLEADLAERMGSHGLQAADHDAGSLRVDEEQG